MGQHFLGACFPDRSGHSDNFCSRAVPGGKAERLQRLERIINQEDRRIAFQTCGNAADHHGCGPFCQRIGRIIMAIHFIAFQRDE